MAKHKHKNPRVNVFFRHQSHFFKLFEAINFGSKSSPELKIKELTETYMQIHDNKKRFDESSERIRQIIKNNDDKLKRMHDDINMNM